MFGALQRGSVRRSAPSVTIVPLYVPAERSRVAESANSIAAEALIRKRSPAPSRLRRALDQSSLNSMVSQRVVSS